MNSTNHPKTASSEQLSAEARRRLGVAVLDVFSSVDFHKASMRTVAQKSGVSLGTIYKYYESKEGLVFAFVNEWLGDLTARIIDHLQGIEDLKEKLRKVFWVQLDYYERNPGLGRIIFMTLPMTTWMSDRSFEQERMIGIFLSTLRQGQQQGALNPNVRSSTLLDIMHGFVQRSFFMWVYRGRKDSLAGHANDWFELIWRALSNPDERF
jgi:AcrR family transcriptional regulator